MSILKLSILENIKLLLLYVVKIKKQNFSTNYNCCFSVGGSMRSMRSMRKTFAGTIFEQVKWAYLINQH
jgi:hypothetical protein